MWRDGEVRPEEPAFLAPKTPSHISRIRFDHHAALISAGAVPDNLIDPDELPPIARTELREALHVVRRAEKQLAGWVPRGS